MFFFIFFVAAVLKLLFEELSPPDKPSLLWVLVVTCFFYPSNLQPLR
jgi:hypothetical protein